MISIPKQLDGKTVIITGATRGMGRSTALLFAAHGARIIATGRSEDKGEQTAKLAREAGGDCVFIRQDITKEADWQRVIDTAMEQYGGLDILVSNAGMFSVIPIADTTEDDFDAIYKVNVEGTWLGMKYAFEAMQKTGRGGAIVNVSSLMGQVGFPNAVAYCATKGAITTMTKAAALEGAQLSPPIRVNSLHPGVIWTEMITDAFGDDQALSDKFAEETPLKIIGLPEYMADAILYLSSDDSSFVTGTELTVDGGRGAD